MRINSKQGYGIVATNIEGINNVEMRQMVEMRQKIERILNSHKGDGKKEYISDEDLTMLHAMLSVFTQGQTDDANTSAFDDFLKITSIKHEAEAVDPIPFDEDEGKA